MRSRYAAGVLCLIGCQALLLASVSQEGPEAPKPGKEHELLRQFEGQWDFVSKFMMKPGKEPVVSKGKETVRVIAGGLFIVFDAEGDMMGQKFVGHGTMGYDVHKKKFTGAWIDSMATGVYLIEGTCDEKGKVFTEWMEGTDPQSGQPMKMKMVHEIKDKDKRVMTFSMKGPDGKDMDLGTIEYTRKK
ncbi:MAG: DUF1579 domain-containing protein [Planctomycetes bacterium]|nr:DUF1579 domain-containing protein [Planctomycetota bacterium]